jgi:hypothetical protein
MGTWIIIIIAIIATATYYYLKKKHPAVLTKIQKLLTSKPAPPSPPSTKPFLSARDIPGKSLAELGNTDKKITLEVDLGNVIKTGTLSLVIDVDWAKANKVDRDFVNAIINQMQDHNNKRPTKSALPPTPEAAPVNTEENHATTV